jgi:Anthrone oxygenase
MFGALALATAAIFFGAAFYVSFAEQPARLRLNDVAALTQWTPAYRRGFAMQATLAVVSGLLGLAAWLVHGGIYFIWGAVAILANWPYTLFAVMPVNRRLEAMSPATATGDTRKYLVRWGRLHAIRTLLGALATAFYLVAVWRLI